MITYPNPISQAEFDTSMSESQNSSDMITLPNETIDWQLIINNPCTIMGGANTIIDVTGVDHLHAIEILADNVNLSDIAIKNKTTPGYHGIYVSGTTINIDRIQASCDVGILLEKCDDVNITEVQTFDATTGIKILNSMNIELNACDSYNNNIGLDIIGDSSVKGNVESYQGFGLNVIVTDHTGLTPGESYEFKVDGMLFYFVATAGQTYQDLVNTINNIIGFNPVYIAEFINNDIVIKTENPQILIETIDSANCLLTDLTASITVPNNGHVYSYVNFGLNVSASDDTGLAPNLLFTFILDGAEIQFYSPEVDGTTYQELVDLIDGKINGDGYITEFINNDIRITKTAPAVTISSGTRFKDLFTELGITIFTPSTVVQESIQGFGLSVLETDVTPLIVGNYSLIVNGIKYIFNNTTLNPTYTQLVSLLNSNTTFTNINTAVFSGGDIQIISSESTILLEENNFGLFSELGTVLNEPTVGEDSNRTDRSHHINVIGCLFRENTIGVRIMNSNDISFLDSCRIFLNTNVGLWQLPSSYNVKFRGEVYANTNYGIRNTDRQGGPHEVDVMDSWWGDITGPSMFGPGEGDKISANVLWQPQRQSGTIQDQTYPKTRDFILGALGYPVIKVELTDEQIELCIDKAIAKFMQYRTPEPTQRYIALGAGSSGYFLPLDIPKEDIIEVTYSPNADIFAQLSGSGESFLMTYYMQGSSSTFLSDFYVAMAYKETMETTLGIGPAYELLSAQDENGDWRDMIRLSPRPDGNVSLGLLVSRPLLEEEIDSTEWIHKYALAWAKEFLGRVRSKFGSVPGPTGEMSLDGPTLLSEAQQEKEKLEESVMLRGTPLGFMVG